MFRIFVIQEMILIAFIINFIDEALKEFIQLSRLFIVIQGSLYLSVNEHFVNAENKINPLYSILT